MIMKDSVAKVVRFFLSFQRPYVSWGILSGLLVLIDVLLLVPMPMVTRYLIDHIIPSGSFLQLHLLCLILVIVLLLKQVSSWFLKYFVMKYKTSAQFDTEAALIDHIQRLPLNFFNRNSVGYLLARLN